MSKPENIGNPEENAVKHSVMRSDEANAASSVPAADTAADGHIPAEKKISNAPENAEKKPPSPEENDGGVDNTPAAPEEKKAGEDSAGIEKAIKKEAEKQIKKETGKEPEKEMKTETKKAAEKPPFFREELRPLRGESRKVFRRSDGMEEAVFYARPVHLPDGKGGFSDETTALPEPEKDGKHYLCDAGAFRARFSREQNDGELFTMEKGRYRVTLTAAASRRKRKKCLCAALCERHGKEGPHRLSFADAEPGADYTYHVGAEGVKEDIVIREKADSYRFPFLVHCEHLRATAERGGKRIALCDEESGEEIFHIPAPFMCDAAGARSEAVRYQLRTEADGTTHLTVVADSDFINAADRVFPVTVDPQIVLSGYGPITSFGWNGSGMSSTESVHTICGIGGTPSRKANRLYLNLADISVPANANIRQATLTLHQLQGQANPGTSPLLGLYKASGSVTAAMTSDPNPTKDPVDYVRIKDGMAVYTFDVTRLIGAAVRCGTMPCLALKLLDEKTAGTTNIGIAGTICAATRVPKLTVQYETDYSVEPSGLTRVHSLGRFGQGIVDLQRGHLMFLSKELEWAGRRMPVTIEHLYNSALSDIFYTRNDLYNLKVADFSAMKLGYGMWLNLMQSMISSTCDCDDDECSDTVWLYTDAHGRTIRYLPENGSAYRFVCERDDGSFYDTRTRILTKSDESLLFDSYGRLVRVTNAAGDRNDIEYLLGRIISVTDGAGRSFGFTYEDGGYLSTITAPDGTKIRYTYNNSGRLSAVTYPTGDMASLYYDANGKPSSVILEEAGGHLLYEVVYTFNGQCLSDISENGYQEFDPWEGGSAHFDYSMAGATVITSEEENEDGTSNEIRGVCLFDTKGNMVRQYFHTADTGNVAGNINGSGIRLLSGKEEVRFASNVNNLLSDPCFDTFAGWSAMPCNCDVTITKVSAEKDAPFGCTARKIKAECANDGTNGCFQLTDPLPAGEYTFSVYADITDIFHSSATPGLYLRITTTDGSILSESIHLNTPGGFTRLTASCTLAVMQNIKVCILTDGCGSACFTNAQLENNTSANSFNLLENGNFEKGTTGWTLTSGVSSALGTSFNMNKSLFINGNISALRSACRSLSVKSARGTRETFVLSGWAKGHGLPVREREGIENQPVFRLRAVIEYNDSHYNDQSKEEFVANFSPCIEGEWQPAFVQFSKKRYRTVKNITVFCEYGYNCGSAYFDDIQLSVVKTETGLSASDFETVYDETNGNADPRFKGLIPPTANGSEEGFCEAKDAYHNPLTDTSFYTDEFGTLYRSFGYSANGNDLLRETDNRGNSIVGTVDASTSRISELTDRTGYKTVYEYDADGRTTKITDKDKNGTELSHVSYLYEPFGNVYGLLRGDGMRYFLDYDVFRNLHQIKIHGKTEPLVTYAYNPGNGRMKQTTYANGDCMKVNYDSVGRVISEKWYNASGVEKAKYLYGYDEKGNIVRSLDFYAQKEYNYVYKDNRLISTSECAVTLAGETVTSRTVVFTALYFYDSEGKLIRKAVTPADRPDLTVRYLHDGKNVAVSFEVPAPTEGNTDNTRTVTCRSGSDDMNRKTFDEIQLGCDSLSRQYAYTAGKVTNEHKAKDKVKSAATTRLVSKVTFSDGRTMSYEYDEEERITRITDSANGVTDYTYTPQGRLLCEKKCRDGVESVVNAMTYDAYGNILSKNGKTYTYGNTAWRDLLTAYNGKAITYDAQGNPTFYLDHRLVWEKGHLLKSFDGFNYTYNANNIRTSKTVGSIKHTYILEGAKILQETWGDHALIPLYDNEDSICGILYDNTPYYFQRNLQGDVIGIFDSEAGMVAQYAYDAWGVCTVLSDTSGCSIATVNPFRYRSYYFDAEIGMYYLQSRYYDPAVGRFISSDDYLHTKTAFHGKNLFAYCDNDPVNCVDPEGHAWSFLSILRAVVTIAVVVVAAILSSVLVGHALDISYIKYDVPVYCQGGTSLCWAYCQVMVESYHQGIVLTQPEADARAKQIAMEVHKDTPGNWNRGGWPTNTGMKIRWIPSIGTVHYYLMINNGPMYAYYSNHAGAHLIVITGADKKNDCVYTNNPWGTMNVQTFSDFKNGYVGAAPGNILGAIFTTNK